MINMTRENMPFLGEAEALEGQKPQAVTLVLGILQLKLSGDHEPVITWLQHSKVHSQLQHGVKRTTQPESTNSWRGRLRTTVLSFTI